MKKVTTWVIALTLATALAGCGGVKPQTPAGGGSPQTPAGGAAGTQSGGGSQAGGGTGAQPGGADQAPSGGATGGARKTYSQPPAMQVDPSKQYTATMKTSLGTMKIQLFAKGTPKTVNNFVFLAKEGFYNGTIFHRIAKNFMIQGGDPQGNGSGGPGYTIPDEYPVTLKYELGTVAMARTQAPNSAGSQFFICNEATCGGLNNQPDYVIFGKVTEGLDVLDKLSSVPVGPQPPEMRGELSKPKTPPTIDAITVDVK